MPTVLIQYSPRREGVIWPLWPPLDPPLAMWDKLWKGRMLRVMGCKLFTLMKIILATIKSIDCWHYQHYLAASANFINKMPGAIVNMKLSIKDGITKSKEPFSNTVRYSPWFLLHHSNTDSEGVYAIKILAWVPYYYRDTYFACCLFTIDNSQNRDLT